MSERVQAFEASVRRGSEEAARAICRDRLRPALLRQPGCRSVELMTAGAVDDGEAVESMLLVRWDTQEQMERGMGAEDVASLLMELLLHVVGAPAMHTYEVDDIGDVSGRTDGAEEITGTDRVDVVWQKVQHEIDPDALDDTFDHPYVKWWFLNNGKVPDFIELARTADAAIADDLLDRYAASCRGGLDDLPTGQVDPRSKTAQHLYYLTRIRGEFPDVEDRRILEIGGGLGNLARIVLQLSLCRSYDLVDIQNVAALQRRYLGATVPPDRLGAVAVRSAEADDDLDALRVETYDLVISTFALSETPSAMLEWYLGLISTGAAAAYLVGQERWRGASIVDRIVEALTDDFDVVRSRTPFESSNVGPGFELVARRR